MRYEVPEWFSNEQLSSAITDIMIQHGHSLYAHKNGGTYYTTSGVIINIDGKSHWGIKYHPVEASSNINKVLYEIVHVRPLSEFLDGRFTKLELKNRNA